MENLSYNEILSTLPPAVRAAIETQDATAFQIALDELPCEEAERIVQQLKTAAIIGPGPATEAEFQEILQEFEFLIRAIVAVARGDDDQREEVMAVLPKLDDAGYHLGGTVPRIWAGERQASSLTDGLDPNSARLIEHILGILAGETQAAPLDTEGVAASIPQAVMAAIVDQDEKAFRSAMEELTPADRVFVSAQLAKLQAKADAEAEDWLKSLPEDVRLAVKDQDTQALQEALRVLPPSQAQEILTGLEATGLLSDLEEPEADLLMTDFEPLVLATASVANGNEKARPQLEALLADLDEQGWHLSAAIQRIWSGEHDISTLSVGLSRQDRQIIQRILQLLE